MQKIIYKFLGQKDYISTLSAMQDFTKKRGLNTLDEIWFLEHPKVFTMGKAGLEQHILYAGDIPVIRSDRGGQVTYHGPGQLIVYFLIDLTRRSLGLKQFIHIMQKSVIELLKNFYNINANMGDGLPGVYISEEKICSIGLKVTKGCSYHGLSLNVDMDLQPFKQIHPCGSFNLKITQLSNFINHSNKDNNKININLIANLLKNIFIIRLEEHGIH